MLRRLHRSSRATLLAQVRVVAWPSLVDRTSHIQQRSSSYAPADTFARRHIGPRDAEVKDMLKTVGFSDMDEFVKAVVPEAIRFGKPLPVAGLTENGLGEQQALAELRAIASENMHSQKSYLGQGYYGNHTPGVILRNVLENPAWYTAYTPYQAEISQGRMQMLLNYQTMVCDLTGMQMANASLLDEGSAAAESLSMCHALHPAGHQAYFVDREVHPSVLAVVKTRAGVLGLAVHVGDPATFDFAAQPVSGALIQLPGTSGAVRSDAATLVARIKESGALVVAACDLLSLTLLQTPGALGCDAAVGSAQRFGVPMGYGGPHAAFLATKDTKTARRMPGRIMSVSIDRERGQPALRMALQTREQHIRRDKATSNICTAQALLANMAASYAIYHGPHGLRDIAERVHGLAHVLHSNLERLGCTMSSAVYFDTISFRPSDKRDAASVVKACGKAGYNVRLLSRKEVTIALDETTLLEDVFALVRAVCPDGGKPRLPTSRPPLSENGAFQHLRRTSSFLTNPVFNSYHSETDMLRYLYSLQSKDLSLASAMIPLGSCTMKLNATSEMIPVSWPEFANMHPFAPKKQAAGYARMIKELETILADVTGFDAMSLQPNSGAQGEYAGLRAIRAFQTASGQGHRDVCLIPTSAHGTNPASAVMSGLRVVPVNCRPDGYIDVAHLKEMVEVHKASLSCIMITYPSTFGVFEENVRDVIELIHKNGGQVYMDGANMNAQVGLTSPGFLGADVCHLNLHKTFCIPHGGGGPGVGPIGVRAHLAPYLPGNPLKASKIPHAVGPMTSGEFGSAGILPIPWMYVKMMGSSGLRRATQMAILNANYMRKLLEPHYKISFRGPNGLSAHEFILDIAPFASHGIHAEDVAKRLIDFGFHAPTMSWPVPETLMVEPTESEPKAEMDRFVEALIHIRGEIQQVVDGKVKAAESVLVRSPHTLQDVVSSEWSRPYTREQAAYPLPWVKQHKFWPSVNRLDNVWGDRNLFCSCDGFAAVEEKTKAKQ